MAAGRVPEEIFFLDRSRDRTLQAQIREAIVSAIVEGRMLPGARLPSTRKLAVHLKVSRLTVTLAYQELVSQGYLATIAHAAAIIVSDAAPRAPDRPGPVNPHGTTVTVDWDAKLGGQS